MKQLIVDVSCCSVSYCAGANGWGGPEYPTCDGCNANGTMTVPFKPSLWRHLRTLRYGAITW